MSFYLQLSKHICSCLTAAFFMSANFGIVDALNPQFLGNLVLCKSNVKTKDADVSCKGIARFT